MYVRPPDIAGALETLAVRPALIVNGGTDVYPAHVGRPLPGDVLDLSAIREMAGIHESETEFRIGAGTTWAAIIRAPLPPAFDALKAAAREVGAVQVQNRGTIGGNLCNASPAADGVPPLLALDADVELTSRAATRRLPLSAFITGYRQTAKRADEIMTAIIVPKRAMAASSVFSKLGARRYLVISIVMVAANIERGRDGQIRDARVAVGAASAVAQRLRSLEAALVSLAPKQAPSRALNPNHLAELKPIDDVRATADYRSDAAATLVARSLDAAWEKAAHG